MVGRYLSQRPMPETRMVLLETFNGREMHIFPIKFLSTASSVYMATGYLNTIVTVNITSLNVLIYIGFKCRCGYHLVYAHPHTQTHQTEHYAVNANVNIISQRNGMHNKLSAKRTRRIAADF